MIARFLTTLVAAAATAVMLALCGRIDWPFVLLSWVAVVPWFAAIDATPSARGALASGLILSELFVTTLFPWIPRAVSDYSGASLATALAVTALIAPLLQPQFIVGAVARYAARRFGGSVLRIAIVGACAYVAADGLLPKLFADTFGHALYASPLWRQGADVAGAHGLTFLLLLVNDAVLAVLRATRRTHALKRRVVMSLGIAVGVPLVLALYGAVRLGQLAETEAARSLSIAIVQANVSHYDRLAQEVGTFEAVRRILDPHFELSRTVLQQHQVDLLVWPETVYPTSFGAPKSEDGAGFDRAIGALVAHGGVPLLFGTYERDGDDEYNVAVLLEAAGAGQVTFDSYRKVRLFPFTEYVPTWLDSPWLRARIPWAGHWKAGTGAAVLRATLANGATLRIAPLICYDAIDPGHVLPAVRDGAELLATLSNDSWFAYPGVQRLILIVSAFRSIETRRPQIRATPTGISAVISATGAITEHIDVDQRGTIVSSIAPASQRWTPMIAWGNWFPYAALIGGMGGLAVRTARPRRV